VKADVLGDFHRRSLRRWHCSQRRNSASKWLQSRSSSHSYSRGFFHFSSRLFLRFILDGSKIIRAIYVHGGMYKRCRLFKRPVRLHSSRSQILRIRPIRLRLIFCTLSPLPLLLSLQPHQPPLFLLARATPSCRVSILMSAIGRGSPSTLRFDLKLLSDGYSTSVGKLKLSICFYIKL